MKKVVYVSIGVLVAILIFSGLALSNKKKSADTNRVNISPTPSVAQNAGQKQSETKEIQVTASEYFFLPSTIIVDKGDRLTVTLRNAGKMPHNLVFEGLGVATKTVQKGQSDTIEFTASEAGTFSFYCSIGNHRDLGMEGSLEVK